MKTKENYQEEKAGLSLLEHQPEEDDVVYFLLEFNSILQFLIPLALVLLH